MHIGSINFAKGTNMRAKAIAYWVTTTLIGLETLAGGVMDLTHGRTNVVSGPSVVDVVTSLSYRVYVLTILRIWKVLGAIVLLVPGFLRRGDWLRRPRSALDPLSGQLGVEPGSGGGPFSANCAVGYL